MQFQNDTFGAAGTSQPITDDSDLQSLQINGWLLRNGGGMFTSFG